MRRAESALRLDRFHLRLVQLPISPTLLDQFIVGAAFTDATLFEDKDLVCLANGGESVGNDEGGSALHQSMQRALDMQFGRGIDR